MFQGALDEAAAASGSFRLESAAIGSQRAAGTGATHRVRSAPSGCGPRDSAPA